ncbi:MAG: transporter [Rhodobacterales bacterium]|nr:transporter [Rhodobacterales bacterium]
MRQYLISLSVGLAVAAATGDPVQALGDGARAYQLVPDGTAILSFQWIAQQGNAGLDLSAPIRQTSVDIDVLVTQYTQTFRIGDQQSALFAALPVGTLNGTLDLGLPAPFPSTFKDSSEPLGDLIVGGIFGFTGSPVLSVADYVAYRPGFAAGGLVKVTLPTGTYNAEDLFNLGTNRWSTQVGVVMGYALGDSLVAPNLTTFEIIPTVTYFGENDDAFRGATVSQDPVYRVEAHVTRNLSQAVWLSADLNWQQGGATTTNGVYDDNDAYSLGVGASIGVNLSTQLSLKATYGEIIDRNEYGLDGSAFRLVANYLF